MGLCDTVLEVRGPVELPRNQPGFDTNAFELQDIQILFRG